LCSSILASRLKHSNNKPCDHMTLRRLCHQQQPEKTTPDRQLCNSTGFGCRLVLLTLSIPYDSGHGGTWATNQHYRTPPNLTRPQAQSLQNLPSQLSFPQARLQEQLKTAKQKQELTKQVSYTFALSPSYAIVQPLDNAYGEIFYRLQPLSPCYCAPARSTGNEARQAKRGAYGRMYAPVEIRLLGPFIYGDKEDNFYDNRRSSKRTGAHTPPRTCPKAPSLAARPCAGGAFDSVVGGRKGGLPIELYLLHPAFCLCYQKPPACTLMPLPHAIESLSARALSCPRVSLPEASSPADSAMISFLAGAGSGERPRPHHANKHGTLCIEQQFTASRLGGFFSY